MYQSAAGNDKKRFTEGNVLIRLQAQPEVVQVAVDVKGRTAGSVTIRSSAMPSAPSWTRHLSAEASAVAPEATAPGEASPAEQRTSAAAIMATPLPGPTAGVVAAVALEEQHTSPGGLSAANFLRPPNGPPNGRKWWRPPLTRPEPYGAVL